ncbi:MAG: hypothetical protein AABZ14_00180 [Candidatus Margulisiibacteriota bacterium]
MRLSTSSVDTKIKQTLKAGLKDSSGSKVLMIDVTSKKIIIPIANGMEAITGVHYSEL